MKTRRCAARKKTPYERFDSPWSREGKPFYIRCARKDGHKGQHKSEGGTRWPKREGRT